MGAATPAEVWGRGGEREEEVNGREEGGLWRRRGKGSNKWVEGKKLSVQRKFIQLSRGGSERIRGDANFKYLLMFAKTLFEIRLYTRICRKKPKQCYIVFSLCYVIVLLHSHTWTILSPLHHLAILSVRIIINLEKSRHPGNWLPSLWD